MAYAPAGGLLLLIGGTAAIVSHDLWLIVVSIVLLLLGYAAGVALRLAGFGPEQEDA